METFASYRHQRWVKNFIKPVAVCYVGVIAGALFKAFQMADWCGLGLCSLALVGLMFPFLAVSLGKQHLALHALVAGHCLYALAQTLIALGLVGSPALKVRMFLQRQELGVEVFLAANNQISIPWAAAIHLLRGASQYLVYVTLCQGNPWTGAWRWTLNFLVLMALQGVFEARAWALYKSKVKEARRQIQRKALDAQQTHHPAGQPATQLPATSHIACQTQATPAQRTGTATAQQVMLAAWDEAAGLPYQERPTTVAADPAAGPVAERPGLVCAQEALSAAPVPAPQHAASPHLTLAGPSGLWHRVGPSVPGRCFLVLEQAGVPSGSTPTSTCPDMHPASPSRYSPVNPATHARPLVQNHGTQHMVHIKMRGMHPEQLPDQFKSLLGQRVRSRMPGFNLTGMSVRHGCVMISLDLTSHLGDPAAMPEQICGLLNDMAADGQLAGVLTHGQQLTIQVGREVVSLEWDAPSKAFKLSTEQPAPSDSAATTADSLQQQTAQCQFLTTPPAVCTLSDSDIDSDPCQLTLPLQLQLPSTCSRLLGWRPRAADGSSVADVSCIQLSAAQSSPTPVEVSVLVRYQGGNYLPVSVTRADQNTATTTTATDGDGHTAAEVLDVQVAVDLPDPKPGSLSVELWVKAPDNGLELLCAHSPVLVLPSQHQLAVAELLQHASGRCGGVGALLWDLRSWVNIMAGRHDPPVNEVVAQGLHRVGVALLLFAVERSLDHVATLVVSVLTAPTPPVPAVHTAPGAPATATAAAAEWLVAAAAGSSSGDSSRGGLLHAALASGSASMLERVLRWGAVYGGRQWQWPWSLTDESGCTALHLAAGHPESGVCQGMVEVLVRMLPDGEVRRVHQCWLHDMGTVGVTPGQWFSHTHSGADLEHVWIRQPSTDKLTGGKETDGNRTNTDSNPRHGDTVTTATAVPGSGSSDAPPVSPTSTPDNISWYDTVSELWRWRPSEQYRQWAKEQLSSMTHCWSWCLVLLGGVGLALSRSDGDLRNEWLPMTSHFIAHGAIVGTSLGAQVLGCWQSWMPLLPLFNALGYLAAYHMPPEQCAFWQKTARNGVDAVYAILMVAPFEQNSLPFMLLSRVVLAYCHSLALATAGLPHPLRHAVLVHLLCVMVNLVMRGFQLRAHHRWRRDRQRGQRMALPQLATDSTGHVKRGAGNKTKMT